MAEVPVKNNLIVEMHVPDFQPVREYYGAFGFDELAYAPASPVLGYLVLNRADVQLGDTMLHFYGGAPEVADQSYFKQFPPETPRGYAVEYTIPVSNLDQLWEDAVPLAGADTVVQPLMRKPWGSRDFRVAGPFGYYVRFTDLMDWGQPDMRLPRIGNE